MSSPYPFAALPKEEIGPELRAKVTAYYADPRVTSIMGVQRVAYATYYTVARDWATGTRGGSVSIASGGEQGEQVVVHVDHARTLARNLTARITNPKFVWEPQASNRGSKSSRAVQKARDVLDHYWHNCNHEALRAQSVQSTTFLGEGFTHYWWDDWSGGKYDVMEGQPVYRGMVRAANVLPMNVIRDPWRFTYDDGDWVIVRERANKYDLAERVKRPQAGDMEGDGERRAEAVKAIPGPMTSWPMNFAWSGYGGTWSNDDIDVLTFYHKDTPVVPGGRVTRFLHDGTVIFDGPLKYKRIPLIRRVDEELTATPFGYASFWTIINIQQLLDTLQTAVATNQATFAGQLIGIKRGSGISLMQLGSALSAIEADDKDDVWAINLTKSPPEVFPHMESLLRQMERQMGTSKVSFGESEGDRQSGSSQALLSAQLTENASQFQTSDVNATKAGAELILNMVQVEARVPVEINRVTQSGSSPFGSRMEVRGSDLEGVDQVFINLGSPISQTTEGRVKLLQVASTLNIPVTPEAFWQVLETGRMEPAAEADVEQAIHIQQENEQILRGIVPNVLMTDDHFRHGHQHTITMADVAAREDPAVVAAFTAHMNAHYPFAYSWWATDVMDPLTGQMVGGPQQDPMYNTRMQGLARGVPPPVPAPTPMPMPTGGGADAAMEPPVPDEPKMPPGNPVAGAQPNMPEMPKNPATGQTFTPNARPTAA